jgi:hypothetical protein
MGRDCEERLQDLLRTLHVQGASGVQFCKDSLSDGFQIAVGLQIGIGMLDGRDDRIPEYTVEPGSCLSCPLWIAVRPFHSHSGVHALVWPQ